MTLAISQRLYSADLRMLACRHLPTSDLGCAKVEVEANGVSFWLCPRRVAVFQSAEGGSVSGVECDPPWSHLQAEADAEADDSVVRP